MHGYVNEHLTSPESVEGVVNRAYGEAHRLQFDVKVFIEFPVSLAGTV